MSDIKILADVLANYSAHRKKPGTRGGGKLIRGCGISKMQTMNE